MDGASNRGAPSNHFLPSVLSDLSVLSINPLR